MRSREELQSEAVQAVMDKDYVIVNWGTGVGKSRVAIKCADTLRKEGRGRRMLLLVAETAHKENWRSEFVEALGKELGNELFGAITVECYASMHKYEWTKWDFIIADEAHHLRSENRTDIISTMWAPKVLCLTATMSCAGDAEELLRTLEITFGEFTNLDFTIQDAIDNKILGEPKIFIHVLNIDDLARTQYIEEAWGPDGKRELLSCDISEVWSYRDKNRYPAAYLSIAATPRQAYDYFTDRMQRAKKKYDEAMRDAEQNPQEGASTAGGHYLWDRYVQYGSRRKIYLGKAKTTLASWIVDKVGNKEHKKFVCFCSDVDQAEKLGGSGRVIHSLIGDTEAVIRDFNEDKINGLFAVNMIQEGQNLKGIQAGIIVQLGGKERQFIQKFGRALRAESPEQHVIVIEGTRDEDYYNAALQGIDPKYIKVKLYGSAKGLGKYRIDAADKKSRTPVAASGTRSALPGVA